MTDQQQRPSDEVTVGVIRAWKDWNSIRVYRRHENEVYYECDDTPQGTPSLYDPRDDTDSALELFVKVVGDGAGETACFSSFTDPGGFVEGGFYFNINGIDYRIPISGQPFRYSVVHLAAKVLWVE